MSNSPLISFIRSLMMMAMLITILLIAVFWNGLPPVKSGGNLLPISWQHFFRQDEEKPDREPRRETLTPTISIPIDTARPSDIPNEPEPNLDAIKDQFQDRFDIAPPVFPEAVEAKLPEDFISFKRTLEQKYDATEVHLERWGREGKLYRFSCYVPEPRGSGVKKLHQSIQPTPALAIRKVMETMR